MTTYQRDYETKRNLFESQALDRGSWSSTSEYRNSCHVRNEPHTSPGPDRQHQSEDSGQGPICEKNWGADERVRYAHCVDLPQNMRSLHCRELPRGAMQCHIDADEDVARREMMVV